MNTQLRIWFKFMTNSGINKLGVMGNTESGQRIAAD